MPADRGELRGAAAKRTRTAVAVSEPSAAAAPAPDRARRAAKPEAAFTARPGIGQGADQETARAAQPGVGGPLTLPDRPGVARAAPTEAQGTPDQPLAFWAPMQSGDIDTALKLLEEEARGGNVAALWKLGRMYADGDGVPQSHLRAFDCFRRIAEIHPPSVAEHAGGAKTRFIAGALVELGRYYLTGIANSDITPDAERAREMFAHAAVDFADPDAQYHLGRMYLEGKGGAKDPRQAARWLYTAATKGQFEAQAAFGSLLFKGGDVVPRDGVKGLMWLKIAMDAAPPGETRIAELYDAAWKQASEKERTAALTLAEQWRNGQAR
jgi:TPR repeat protein